MNEPAPVRTAAFFDLDKTILSSSSTLAFGRSFYRGGLINRRAVLTVAYAQFVYLLGGASHDQMERMRAYLSQMSTGWDVSQVREIVADTLHELIQPLIYEEAARLIDAHHDAGRDVVIVSSSGAEIVEPIGEMLGADRVIATRMLVADGRFTGDIDFYSYREHKAVAVRELAAQEGYDLARSYAYSDSATDLPLLEAVGRPHVVNPDRALRRVATERGWPVLMFVRTVRMTDHAPGIPLPPPKVVAGVVVAAGTAAAVWLTLRHRRRRPARTPAMFNTGRSWVARLHT